MIGRCRDALDLPVSALVAPTLLRRRDDFVALRDAGADRVGVAIDAATPELFDRHRGAGVSGPHRWERYWDALADAIAVFGAGRVSVHAMVGLGETEEQLLDLMARVQGLGAAVHLFSFCAEAGSSAAGRAAAAPRPVPAAAGRPLPARSGCRRPGPTSGATLGAASSTWASIRRACPASPPRS